MSLRILGVKFVHRMPWVLHYLSLFIPFAMSIVSVVDSGVKIPIYWNSSNPIFNNSGQMNVNFGDSIDVHCPKYPASTPENETEHYVIYLFVAKEEYDTCRINDPAKVKIVMNCTLVHYITILVSNFIGIPLATDFKVGKYYIVSTSTGTLKGMNNRVGGVCETKNMKLVMDVCCDSSSTNAPTNNTDTTKATTSAPTPSPTTKKPTTPSPSTRKPTTSVRTTKSTTTTIAPPSSTTKFPGGIPSDPSKDIVIDATSKNSGIINSAKTLQPIKSLLCLSSLIVTIMILIR